MATIETQTIDPQLEQLGRRVAELSVPYAHALAEYSKASTAENWRDVDRTEARWRHAVDKFDTYQLILEAKDDGDLDPGF